MAQQVIEAVPGTEGELVDLWIVYNKRGSIMSVSTTEVPGATQVKVRPEKVAETMTFTPPKAWVIKDPDGGLLFRAFKPIADPRIEVVPATDAVIDAPIKEMLWITKDQAGNPVDVNHHYPFNPTAQAFPADHPEVAAAKKFHTDISADFQRRRDAWHRVKARLIDEELAKAGK